MLGGRHSISKYNLIILTWITAIIFLSNLSFANNVHVFKNATLISYSNRNFSFVREALEVMCSPEFNVTGVLVANKNKQGTKACTIPAAWFVHYLVVVFNFVVTVRFSMQISFYSHPPPVVDCYLQRWENCPNDIFRSKAFF